MSQLVDRARAARVAEDHGRAYIGELHRWARQTHTPRRSWWPIWLGGGLTLAIAMTIVLVVVSDHAPHEVSDHAYGMLPLEIGQRVAIVAEPATRYKIITADLDRTEIMVERGTVTARLFHGERHHHLVLTDGIVHANANGTVYSLTVGDRGTVVDVHDGTVQVVRETTAESVSAMRAWPSTVAYHTNRAASTLLSIAPPTSDSPPSAGLPPSLPFDAAVLVDATPLISRPPPVDAVLVRSSLDRWRRARLLRGQGDFSGAVDECLAIADVLDPTWSPIALLEAARIELGPRASPERTISLVDRFLREWPSHQLAPEAREVRCRALRQLGRETECSAPP